MAPSESVPAAIANGLPSAPPDFDDVGRAVEPNGHDNGCLDGAIEPIPDLPGGTDRSSSLSKCLRPGCS
jgi:hypothetical protein